MQRPLLSLGALSVLAATALAQTPPCFEQNFGVLAPRAGGQAGYGDDVFFDLQPLGFNFPMAGNAATYSHVHISENGICYLTNGAPTNGAMGIGNAYQNTQYFIGDQAGDDPRIAPLFMDLDSVPANGGGVFINNTLPGKFVITWANMVEWWATTQAGPDEIFTFQAQIFANGDVFFYHDGRFSGATYPTQLVVRTGISRGNAAPDPGQVDLSAAAGNTNVSDFVMYEEFPVGPNFDLSDTTSLFLYAGTGYIQAPTSCTPAFHENYGKGCYDISDSFYQLFPDAVVASAGLTGQSMVMVLAGSQYAVSWGGGSYVSPSPSATTVFPLGTPTDDGEAPVTPSVPFPTPSGAQATLMVHSNGIIYWGGGAGSMQTFPGTNNYTPSAGGFLNDVYAGVYSWHDYAEQDVAGGRIVYEEVTIGSDPVLIISWDNVDSWPLNVANPSFMQFQLNLANGTITIVWQSIDNNASSPFGSAHLIGYTPAGASVDPGSVDLASALPFATQSLNIPAMTLSASPAPISSTTSGTAVVYTTSNMPEFATGANTYIGLTVFSLGQVAAGVDLGFLGAPRCRGYVASIDFAPTIVGTSSTNTITLNLPSGVAFGTEIFAQSVAVFLPNTLANGQNPAGLITSNATRAFISNF